MKKYIYLIGAGILGLSLPIAGMSIAPTRNLILGLAPDEAILALADKIDEQSQVQEARISELEKANSEQKESLERLNESEETRSEKEEEQKRLQCETKLKNAQDSLADLQRNLDSDQKSLALIASEKDYKECKNQAEDKYNEDKKDNDPNAKKRYEESMKNCKDDQDGNLATRKSDIQGDKEKIEKQEASLQSLKNECNQYLN